MGQGPERVEGLVDGPLASAIGTARRADPTFTEGARTFQFIYMPQLYQSDIYRFCEGKSKRFSNSRIRLRTRSDMAAGSSAGSVG